MTVAYEGHGVTVHIADALDVLAGMADASVDAVVTDPPYGLEFMGKEWDKFNTGKSSVGRGVRVATERAAEMTETGKGHSTSGGPYLAARVDSVRVAGLPFQQWCEAWARECLRVLKPGGHLLAFGGTRTWHRLACAIEDAGFEVRDSIAWLYGSGFPKSLDVSKAIDKAAGHVGEVIGTETVDVGMQGGKMHTGRPHVLAEREVREASPGAARWQGWGTALKPAHEPIVVARKPLAGTVAANVLTYGTGALNVDGCRVEYVGTPGHARFDGQVTHGDASSFGAISKLTPPHTAGRWPANVVLDDTTAAHLDEQIGDRPGFSTQTDLVAQPERPGEFLGTIKVQPGVRQGFNDEGGPSRFFPTFRYEAKAPTTERPRIDDTAHPTVKPLDLMRWLIRLVTPTGGLVLDPFAGSGTTAEACILEGFRCVTIDKEPEHLPLILQRINRQRDPVEAIRQRGEDLGLFDHLEETP